MRNEEENWADAYSSRNSNTDSTKGTTTSALLKKRKKRRELTISKGGSYSMRTMRMSRAPLLETTETKDISDRVGTCANKNQTDPRQNVRRELFIQRSGSIRATVTNTGLRLMLAEIPYAYNHAGGARASFGGITSAALTQLSACDCDGTCNSATFFSRKQRTMRSF